MNTTSRHFSQNSPVNKRNNEQEDSSPRKRARLDISPVKAVSDRKRLRLEARRKELLPDNNKRVTKRNQTPVPAVLFNVPKVAVAEEDTAEASEYDHGGTAISALFMKAEAYKPLELQVGLSASGLVMCSRFAGDSVEAKVSGSCAHVRGRIQMPLLRRRRGGGIIICVNDNFLIAIKVASKELGVKLSTAQKLPSAMVNMDRRDIYLKTCGWLLRSCLPHINLFQQSVEEGAQSRSCRTARDTRSEETW